MRVQQSGLGPRQTTGQRRGVTGQPPANPHRAGHSSAFHPEDQSSLSRELTDHRTQGHAIEPEYELEEGDEYYETRPPTSTRRYLQPEYVIQEGNRRFIIHPDQPPVRRQHQPLRRQQYYEEEPKPKRYVHFLVFVGIVIFIMIVGWVGFSDLGTWWQSKLDDWTYGQNPRIYQTDAVVGHGDSSTSPSHFIALNLRGQIIIIELPGGNAARARSYTITTVQGNDGNPPVKVSFQDLNADGKLDLIVTIGDPGSAFTVMLFNDGTQFVAKLK